MAARGGPLCPGCPGFTLIAMQSEDASGPPSGNGESWRGCIPMRYSVAHRCLFRWLFDARFDGARLRLHQDLRSQDRRVPPRWAAAKPTDSTREEELDANGVFIDFLKRWRCVDVWESHPNRNGHGK